MFELLTERILSAVIFLPLLFALGTYGVSKTSTRRILGLGGVLLNFLLTLHIWFYFPASSSEYEFTEFSQWMPGFGINYILGVDGLSLLLVVLTGFLMLLMMISVLDYEDKKAHNLIPLLLLLESGIMGSLCAVDLVCFYIFWEAMLIPMYFMIGIWGGKNRIYATTKFMIYTVAGSLFMLVAMMVLYLAHFEQFGVYSSNLTDLYKVSILPLQTQSWLFLAFVVAFAIKIPMWPFHTWLPHAHTEAPTVGSVILAGVLLKLGTYGFLRFVIPLFPLVFQQYAFTLAVLGIIGIVYGALVAWMQEDAKKLVAYSSISHLGFVILGLVVVLENNSLSEIALTGALYQMICHGIATGALFFLIGCLYERRHSRMLSDFGGVAKIMPRFSILFVIAVLGSVGLPGTGGFIGEFLILLGMFEISPFLTFLAASGVLLSAVYMLTLTKRLLFGKPSSAEVESMKDVSAIEVSYLAPLAILIVLMGVFPSFFLSKTQSSLSHLAKNYHHFRLVSAITPDP